MPPKKNEPPPPAAAEPEETEEKFGVWEGEKDKNQLPHGKGKATYPNGDTFEGTIEHNQREKEGVYTWKHVEGAKCVAVYKGSYESNLKHGNGTMTYPDGGVYEGSWDHGLRQGQGTFKYPNGDSYVGSWSQGKKSGQGIYFSFAGSCWYSGVWKDGNFQEGEWLVLFRFISCFPHHKLSCVQFKDRSKYIGAFRDGKPAPGEGVFVFPNGNRLKGQWVCSCAP
uniref:Uncharacterized protein n=1 Tax=Guillardia theta TaxID=55529 RepID=A0A7S4NZR1_GUITH|mmetsp:Transcript_39094/g.123265  ORF Transcript_39094/g.123265 Transcript_39094/m.123265 type:complete len:224 (+) Transcript_39094:73-744(+)